MMLTEHGQRLMQAAIREALEGAEWIGNEYDPWPTWEIYSPDGTMLGEWHGPKPDWAPA